MFLEEIVQRKKEDVARRKAVRPLAEIRNAAYAAAPARSFAAALRERGPAALITEIKRASPSKGPLRPDLNPAEIARTYAAGGAAAISVLTEEHFFRGSFADLAAARAAVTIPILCKDFIIDPYQLYLARAHGADAVLLIAALLSESELAELLARAQDLGLDALVEIHSRPELELVLKTPARVIGINNRDLKTFATDFNTCLSLKRQIPPGKVTVAESGIRTAADIAALKHAGFDAALIGEALVTAPSPAEKLRELLGGESS